MAWWFSLSFCTDDITVNGVRIQVVYQKREFHYGKRMIILPFRCCYPMVCLFFPVVTCDMGSIPRIAHATRAISREPTTGNLTLPGSVTVTYTCGSGYELANELHDTVSCVTNSQPREGRPEGDDSVLVTAKWTGDRAIYCKKGQLPLRFGNIIAR